MRHRMLMSVIIVIASAVAITQSNPRVGTWKLNIAKSKYSPDPHHKSQTAKYEMTADGAFKITVDTIPAEGEPRHDETIAKTDGKDYSVKGDEPGATRAFTRIDDHTWQVVVKQNGNVLTRREVISTDGKTMTVTVTGKNARGETVNSVVVYDKQ